MSLPLVFKGRDRVAMTPCMIAFEAWWPNNKDRYARLGVEDAWRIFREGFWASEDQSHEVSTEAAR